MSEPTITIGDIVLPAGTIHGAAATAQADGSDVNPHPDLSAFNNVQVTFTPSDGAGKRISTVVWNGEGGPIILHPRVETGRFVDGKLLLDINPAPDPDGMRLMASVHAEMIPPSWGYKPEFKGYPSNLPPKPKVSPVEPGAVIDLATVVAGGLPEVPEIVYTDMLNVLEQVPGQIATMQQIRDEVELISGLTGEDDAVAALVSDPLSATGGAARTLINPSPKGPIDGRDYGMVLGAIRSATGTWTTINDANHRSSFISHVEQTASAVIVHHPGAGTARVGTMVVTPDETLAALGYTCGASVGLDRTTIQIYRRVERPVISDYITYNGTDWVSTQGRFTNFTFTPVDGQLRFEHAAIPDHPFMISLTERGGAYRCVGQGLGTNYAHIQFVDNAGAVGLTPNTDMRVLVTRGTPASTVVPVNPSTVQEAGGNIWIFGVMEN